MPAQSPVVMYTDGACSGNPGPGGWGAILIEAGRERELSGGENPTTNQRMELTAPIEGLRALEDRRRVDIYSDSAYVINCFRDRWYERWRKNGWRNSNKKPVENRDLWEALIALVEQHDVTWHKVAGHSGDPLNDRADTLARGAIKGVRS
ncbi:MAG TPA: ribonuclease HI [Methylomirabilota bacterium]|nr:ribonuclease HI [Methylomirabilota bacterium]